MPTPSTGHNCLGCSQLCPRCEGTTCCGLTIGGHNQPPLSAKGHPGTVPRQHDSPGQQTGHCIQLSDGTKNTLDGRKTWSPPGQDPAAMSALPRSSSSVEPMGVGPTPELGGCPTASLPYGSGHLGPVVEEQDMRNHVCRGVSVQQCQLHRVSASPARTLLRFIAGICLPWQHVWLKQRGETPAVTGRKTELY